MHKRFKALNDGWEFVFIVRKDGRTHDLLQILQDLKRLDSNA